MAYKGTDHWHESMILVLKPDSITVENNATCDTDRLQIINSVRAHHNIIMYAHPFWVTLFCQYGQTTLIRAARWGHAEAVSALVEAGADMNLQDKVSEPN